MMKRYEMTVVNGVPVATVIDGSKAEPLHWACGESDPPHPIAWGKFDQAAGYLGYMILRDALGDRQRAERLHHRFCCTLIMHVAPGEPWLISAGAVRGLALGLEAR